MIAAFLVAPAGILMIYLRNLYKPATIIFKALHRLHIRFKLGLWFDFGPFQNMNSGFRVQNLQILTVRTEVKMKMGF